MNQTPTVSTTAVAWTLAAPGAKGRTKEYRVLTIDRWVVIGFGTIGGSRQYKVALATSPESARTFALSQTALKEKGGYALSMDPFQKDLGRDMLEWLERNPVHRGGHWKLDRAFDRVFGDGERI